MTGSNAAFEKGLSSTITRLEKVEGDNYLPVDTPP
jgi:hypothetical protein